MRAAACPQTWTLPPPSSLPAPDDLGQSRPLAYLQPDDILPIHFTHVVVGEEPIAGRRTPFDDRGHLPLLDDEANMASAVLVHGDSPLERPAGGGGDSELGLGRGWRRAEAPATGSSPVPNNHDDLLG